MSVEVGTSGYVNIAVLEAARKRTWLSLSLLLIFMALYLSLLPVADYPEIIWLTLIPASLALWLGPLQLLARRGERVWYDPATLFYLAVFYYCMKGTALALGRRPVYLQSIQAPGIIDGYRFVVVCVTAGMIAWWLGYRFTAGSLQRRCAVSRPAGAVAATLRHGLETSTLYRGVLLLSLLGLLGWVMFFHSVGVGVGAFIANPILRCHLTDGVMGVSAPWANLWKQGMMMWPLATTLWLAGIGSQGLKPGPAWWLHAAGSLFLHLVISGRGETIGFILSVIFVYHVAVGKLSWRSLALLGAAGGAYAYLVRTWRLVAGGLWPQSGTGGELLGAVSLAGFRSFLHSADLADIRLFVLIFDVYGNTVPLKYGATLLLILSQLVPRFVWPTKPPDLGVEITNLYEGGSTAGTPAGFFAEMYMNFGVPGVVAGSALLGAALAWLYRRWGTGERRPIGLALYAILLPIIPLLPSLTFANAVIDLAFLMTAMLLVLRVVGVTQEESLSLLRRRSLICAGTSWTS